MKPYIKTKNKQDYIYICLKRGVIKGLYLRYYVYSFYYEKSRRHCARRSLAKYKRETRRQKRRIDKWKLRMEIKKNL